MRPHRRHVRRLKQFVSVRIGIAAVVETRFVRFQEAASDAAGVIVVALRRVGARQRGQVKIDPDVLGPQVEIAVQFPLPALCVAGHGQVDVFLRQLGDIVVRGALEIADHVGRDAERPRDFLNLKPARGDKLGVSRRHRDRLIFQPLLQNHDLAGVLQTGLLVFPVLPHALGGVGGQFLVRRQDPGQAGALPHPLRRLALIGQRQADRFLGHHDPRRADQPVHREAADVENIFRRDQKRLAAQLAHEMQAVRCDPIEQLACRRLPQRDPVSVDRNEFGDLSALRADFDGVGVPSHDEGKLHHFREFKPVLPIVGPIQQGVQFVVGRRLARARPVQAEHARRELREILA